MCGLCLVHDHLVWVMLHSQLAVSLLDAVGVRVLAHLGCERATVMVLE
jgi:hypothetical protein